MTSSDNKYNHFYIKQAEISNIEELGILFNDYRVFYGQKFDILKSMEFIRERIQNNDSVIFIAINEKEILGFTQLFPSFTSIGIQKIWILNDLFVAEQHRQKSIAEKLINHVIEFSKKTNRKKVILSTAFTNTKAQNLYEKLGFMKTEFINFERYTNNETTN